MRIEFDQLRKNPLKTQYFLRNKDVIGYISILMYAIIFICTEANIWM